MPHIKTTLDIKANDFIKKASYVASYYGFRPLEIAFKKKKGGKNKLRIRNDEVIKKTDSFSNELADIIKSYVSHNPMTPEEPILLYRNRIIEQPRNKNNKKIIRFGLSVLGIEKSVAEALILKTALAILDDIGLKENCVHINSIGDRDSATSFTRELQSYLRKHINEMPAQYREMLKRNTFQAFEYLRRKKHPAHKEIPRSMEFLSDKSRKHLREVLEYLEAVDVPYEINNELIGNKDCYSQTLFEIRNAETDENVDYHDDILVRGGRCDEIANQLFRLNVPVVGIMFEYSQRGINTSILKQKIINRKPKIYFIQLGARAKLHSLQIIEMLRKSGVPISQSLSSDALSTQLEIAKNKKIPYVAIMGQRETLDGTVIVRDLKTQSQNTISIASLPDYIKKIKIK